MTRNTYLSFFQLQLIFLLILVANISVGQIQPVRTEPVRNTRYLEHLPADYNSTTKSYPLLIWLHGTGERGTNIDKVRYFGISNHIENGHDMTFNAGGSGQEFSFIVMSPQLDGGSWNAPTIKELINHAVNTYRVDPARIYLVGLSLGGNGVWNFIYNVNHNNPNRVAALVPIAAWGNKNIVCDLGTPTYALWGFHGENDGTITLNRGQVMIDAYNDCVPAPDQQGLFTIYSGVGHNSWSRAFRTDNSLHTPNMYEWLLLQTLGGNPVANAGSDQTITLPTNSTSFAGSGTDSDGSIASYLWSQLSGPACSLVNATSANLTVNDLLEGTYVFELEVTDNDGNTGADQVNLVVEPAFVNQAPNANAGSDQSITLPTNSLNLTGAGSDSDGTITTYAWTKQSGPSAIMTNENQATLSLTNMLEGTYVFRLTVTDNNGATDLDEATVTVSPAAVNQTPSVNAGSNQTLNLPTNTINLIGVASDPDGTIVSYLWTKQSGPASGTLVNSNQATLTVNSLVAGIYVFRLTVTDNQGATAMDDVTVTVVSANIPPSANAGSNLFITLPTNQINISGSGSDTDGTIVSYLWTKQSGPAATLTNTSQPTFTASNLLEGTYTFRLLVTDDDGASTFDEMILVVSAAPVNQNPIANAGADINFSLPQTSVTITGSGTDLDGTIVSFAWTKVSGPSATLTDSETPALIVTNMMEGNYVFELLVTDNDGAQDTDQITVAVFPPSVNQSPVVDAGIDRFLVLPTNTITITAAVTDDGTIASYLWTKESGPSATMNGEFTISLDITDLVLGVYTFRLTVLDDGGALGFDEVVVDVSSVNLPPIVNVGADIIVTTSSTPFNVIATSNDPDGTIVSSNWTQESGPAATFSQNVNELNLTQVLEGVCVFRLIVTDNLGASTFDEMEITVNPAASNQVPTVNAGTNQTIILPTNSTSIAGTATDSDGSISSYLWTKISGPSGIVLQNQSTASLSLTNLSIGVFTFRLTATDNDGGSNFDEVQITVVDANQPPVADAGSNKSITLPLNSLVITGSGTDSDGTIVSYLWTKITGPSATLSNSTTAILSLSNLLEGNYTFRLQVTDDDGATGTNTVGVIVQPSIVNQAPSALAGTNQTIQLPTNTITLFGNGSDNDGSIVGYLWAKISGPTATLINDALPNLSITNMLEGVYVFQLVVTDDDGATGSDNVTVTVLSSAANNPPLANAGADMSINLPTNSANISGNGSDSDGSIQSYLWELISGPPATLSNQNTSALTISDCIEGSYVLRLTVMDDDTETNSDQMTLTVLAESLNQSPIVNAGINITIQLPNNTTEISGTASDLDGSIISLLWAKISGPTATLLNETTSTLEVQDMLEGQYLFNLSATDDQGASGSDDVLVTVLNESANLPPIANAGIDQTVSLPNNSIILLGAGQDTDGTIASYLWEKISGPTYNFIDATLENFEITDMLEGQYNFQLTVTDNIGDSGSDQVNVTILPQSVNQAPTANAGGNRSVSIVDGAFTVNGNGIDPEGGALTYLWEVTSSPGGTFGDFNQEELVVSNILLGAYGFKLTVTDDQGASTFDFSTITVISADFKIPLADAGQDKTVELSEVSALIIGKGTDSDGLVIGYKWSQIGGASITMEFADTDSLRIANLSQGTLEFELVVTDNDGLSGADTVSVEIIDLNEKAKFSDQPPKIFSPNGDGINDTWIFTEDIQSIADCSLIIFDRFGKRIYEAQPYLNDWEGVFNGQQLREDAYYYVFECEDGSSKSGGVRIIR